MTDSFDPKAPKSSRKKARREPATIDLKAKVVDPGPSEEQKAAEAERLVNEAMSEPEPPRQDVPPVDTPSEGAPPHETPRVESPREERIVEPVAAIPETGTASEARPVLESESEPATEHGADRDSLGAGAGEAEPPPPPPPPVAEPPPRRTSAGALIGAGIIGGLVGAGALYGLQMAQQGQTVPDDQRLAQLEQRVSALRAPADTQALDRRIAALEQARTAADQRLQAAQNAAEQATAAAQDATRQAQEALNRPAPQAVQQNNAALDDLSGRVSELEKQLQSQGQDLKQATAAAQGLQQPVQDLQQAVQDLRQNLQGAQQFAQGLQQSTQQELKSLDGRIAQADQRLAALDKQVSAGPDETTLATVRLALAQRLNDALRQGTSYGPTLAALKEVEPNSEQLSALAPFAQEGAPTVPELARSFKEASAAILRDERSATGDWGDRFQRMLDRVITVRPVNQPGAAGVPSIVAHIQQALDRGDLQEAVSAWKSLPEPARQLSADWGRKAEARLQAEAAVQAVAGDALATLNRPKQQ